MQAGNIGRGFLGQLFYESGYGIIPENIITGIIAAISYDYSEDQQAAQLSKLLKEKGIKTVLKEICKVQPETIIGKLIISKYQNEVRSQLITRKLQARR